MALMADLGLRASSHNQESLDMALETLQTCSLTSTRLWSGAALFAQLDRLMEKLLFVEIYHRYADKKGL